MYTLIRLMVITAITSIPLAAQMTNFTATITDSDSLVWSNGKWTAQLYNPNSGTATLNGNPIQTQYSGTLNSAGTFSISLPDNLQVAPAGTKWTFTILPNASSGGFSYQMQVTGASQNGSSALSAASTPPRFPASPNAFGYADVEVTPTPIPGSGYFNVITNTQRIWNGYGWQNNANSSTNIAIPTANVIADYHFQDGAGLVVTDSSGNANNGIANANTTWVPNGLDFSDPSSTSNIAANVALPNALNATKTFLFVGYWKPFLKITPSGQYQVILTDSTSNTFNIFSTSVNQANNYSTPEGGYQVSLVTSALNTASTNSIIGLNSVAVICGTSGGNLDRIFINGVEVNYNGRQNFSCPSTVSGSLFIGPNPTTWPSGALNATMYRALFWNSALTAIQIAQASKAALQEVISRGINPNPPTQTDAGTISLNCNGDSITFGQGVTNSWCTNTLLPPVWSGNPAMPNWTLNNWGISGIAAMATRLQEPYRIAPSCNAYNGSKPTVIIFLGTNDLYLYVTSGSTAAQAANQVWGYVSSMVRTYKTAGCSVYVASMLSRNQTSSANGLTMDANKDAYDQLMNANWRKVGADGFIDFAANPVLGADGAATNSTYFQADGVHPTQAGQQLLANAAGATLNYYYSQYSETFPHVLITTTSLATSDVAVSIGAASASVALTLPDCTGPTGATFTIQNPQSTQTVTVVGLNASQTINGLTTPITIPANSTARLAVVANPYTTSGCRWIM